MKKTFTLAILVITLTGCDALTRENVKGTYIRVSNEKASPEKLQFTSSKVSFNFLFGEMAYDYHVEDGFVFVGAQGIEWKYKRLGADTLVNDENLGLEGTYVRRD